MLESIDDGREASDDASPLTRRWDRLVCCWQRSVSPWSQLRVTDASRSIPCSLHLGPFKVNGRSVRSYIYLVLDGLSAIRSLAQHRLYLRNVNAVFLHALITQGRMSNFKLTVQSCARLGCSSVSVCLLPLTGYREQIYSD